jgi:hypothetical protein
MDGGPQRAPALDQVTTLRYSCPEIVRNIVNPQGPSITQQSIDLPAPEYYAIITQILRG